MPIACGSIPGRDPLRQPQDQPEVLQVRPHRRGDARILDLDRDLPAVGQPRPVDLADRGRGDRLLVELVEHVLQRLAELVLDHLSHLLERDRRGGVAERGELTLELLAVLLGDEPDVEEGHHLPDLHRRALHRPECGHDLLRGLDVAPFERSVAPLLGPGEVGCVGARLPDRLTCREPPDPSGTPHARGGDLVLRHCAKEVYWALLAGPNARSARVSPGQAGLVPAGSLASAAFATSSTRDPGTMSSEPSGQRTHALWPPS